MILNFLFFTREMFRSPCDSVQCVAKWACLLCRHLHARLTARLDAAAGSRALRDIVWIVLLGQDWGMCTCSCRENSSTKWKIELTVFKSLPALKIWFWFKIIQTSLVKSCEFKVVKTLFSISGGVCRTYNLTNLHIDLHYLLHFSRSWVHLALRCQSLAT